MPRGVRLYVRYVEAMNRVVGRIAMYMIFAMIGVLLYSTVSRSVFEVPLIWVVEVSQFMMVAYFLLGGGYSMQLDAHVRMDLFYGRWSDRTRAVVDAFTILFLIVYLVLLLTGGVSSTLYALEYGQKNYSTWAPPLAPIKIIMTLGVALMLLQAIATFFRDVARARGEALS